MGLGDFRFGTGALGGPPKQRLVARPRLSSVKTKCQFKETTSQTIIATHHSTKRQERAVIHRESKHPISYQTDALEIGQTLLQMALGCNHTNSRCTLDVDCTNNKHTESNLRNRNEAPFLARGNPSLHQPPRATLRRYQDASITCHQMSHWCCACHTTSHCNVHATYHSLHQPPRATLQRYQDASIDCACHQMSHWCCACHTTSQFNVPFPAPATQIHAATGSVTCTSEPISRVQASQFHVYKRTRALLYILHDASAINCNT